MKNDPAKRMIQTLKQAIKKDSRSLYRIAKLADLHYSVPDRFMRGQSVEISIVTAARLADVVGLELRRRAD